MLTKETWYVHEDNADVVLISHWYIWYHDVWTRMYSG